jgi:hypothetical protein
MSVYAILIYGNEKQWEKASQEDRDQVMKGHQVFGETNQKVLRGGEALQPTSTATTIRPDANGKFIVTDAPFAETKEALGGFYLVEAKDLDAAIAIAKQIPMPAGGVEVRPVVVFD